MTEEEAKLLGVYHVSSIWDEAVAVYSKYASNAKGEAGKKEWKTLAVIVADRTHGAVQIVDKTNAPSLIIASSSSFSRCVVLCRSNVAQTY